MKKNILIGISGGIAAYKAARIISLLKKKDYEVKVIMTKNATRFISKLTIETISKNRVITSMWDEKYSYDVEHISLSKWADLILVIPCSYNIIGKVANGIADDMLTTVISATKSQVYFALSMNENMYLNPILKENIKKLKNLNYHFIEAATGMLACNVVGIGRLKEEEEIVENIEKHFSVSNLLKNKKILITAGATKEKLDPIRFLTNNSSGKMGFELAKKASEFGAKVVLIAGSHSQNIPQGIKYIQVESALQMLKEVKKYYEEQEAIFSVAAVADYRPLSYSNHKIKKNKDNLNIELVRNPDILFELGQNKKEQILVGFCAESQNLLENAKEKLRKKNLDFIVANDAKYFSNDKNKVYIIDKNENIQELAELAKKVIAEEILKIVFEI